MSKSNQPNQRITDALEQVNDAVYRSFQNHWREVRLRNELKQLWPAVDEAKAAFLRDPEKQRRLAALRNATR